MAPNRRNLIRGAVALVLLCVAGFVFLLPRLPEAEPTADEPNGSPTPSDLAKQPAIAPQAERGAGGLLPKPRLFRSTRYPPVTEEERAMWAWWREMERRDPQFEWKTPIEFYGKVVDQSGRPVTEAAVRYSWTTAVGPRPDPSAIATSSDDGAFAISGLSGKRLVVEVSKDGFVPLRASRGSFEYSAFFDELFHVPDPATPVVFRLQRLHGASRMYKHECDIRLALSDSTLLDVAAGRFGSVGDFRITTVRRESGDGGMGSLILQLEAPAGAGLVVTSDELMFEAPPEGYDRAVEISIGPGASQGPDSIRGRLYVRTRAGTYAAIELESIYWQRRNEVTLNAVVYFNPDGSRNLEFDRRNWINR